MCMYKESSELCYDCPNRDECDEMDYCDDYDEDCEVD